MNNKAIIKKNLIKKLKNYYHRMRYNGVPFSIISNNCWGGEIYPTLNMKYLTPFVGLFLYPACYLKLLTDFHFLINSKIYFIEESKYQNEKPLYPVGFMGNGIEIHFLHYKTKEDAYKKWNRRVERLVTDKNRFFFKLDDCEKCTDDIVVQFHNLDHNNKISFTKNVFSQFNNNYKIFPEHLQLDGLELFTVCNQYFDLITYLNSYEFKKSINQKIFHQDQRVMEGLI